MSVDLAGRRRTGYFHVEIKAEVTNRMGVLARVASAIAATQTNIDRVSRRASATATPRCSPSNCWCTTAGTWRA